jgi:peptide deformylase
MKKSMSDYDACGLAAPQLGVSLRIIVLQFSEEMLKHFDEKTVTSREIKPFPLKVISITYGSLFHINYY